MAVRTEKAGWVTTVIHNRPEARNAMDPASADALVDAFLAFNRDPDARVAVLWGEGGAFCSGWDLKYGASLQGRDGPLRELDFPDDDTAPTPRGGLGPTRLALDKPVIAAVAGPAVAGGMELALWCDLRVMEEDAYFGVYCRRWGIPLLDGGTVRLPRLVGQGRALDIILTGRKVTAEECLRIGACERVVATGTSRREAEGLAREIAGFPHACVRADRRSVYLQHGLTVREAMKKEWQNGIAVLEAEGIDGATKFTRGAGRHGDFTRIED
jgi:enoyl-CoA hydratase